MAEIKIAEVESSSDLNQFIQYPNRLYRDDPNYVTPLVMERKEFFDTEKNPFYKGAKTKLFLALDGKEVVGRIATCIDFNYNDHHEESTGAFGFFDCPDNYDIASKLLKVAMIELTREGMQKMRGPLNFSSNHELGFLVEGFDSPPSIMMTYNQPYLPRLAEKFGLKKAMDLIAYRIEENAPVSDRIRRISQKIKERSKVTLRPMNMKKFDEEVQMVREIYNRAWQDNWGFVPLTEAEFEYIAANMKQIVDPDLVLIVEQDGEAVAFVMALPNINQALIRLNGRLFPFGLLELLWHTKVRNKIDSVRVLTMGVVPEFRKRGIDSMINLEIMDRAVAKGYKWGEISWVLETNELMRSAADHMGAKPYKRYRLVEMPL